MKYLKYILGAIVLIVLIFLASGLLTPSITYESEIVVDKPLEEAWAVMNDESKIDQWLKGITNIEHVSGEKGKVGAVTRYTFTENGQESTIVETIKAFEPNDFVEMDFEMKDVMLMEYRVDFEEQEGNTQIKSTTNNIGQGIFMKSMMSFMKGTMKDQEDENMANLKKLIEENETDYFPEPEEVEVEMESE